MNLPNPTANRHLRVAVAALLITILTAFAPLLTSVASACQGAGSGC